MHQKVQFSVDPFTGEYSKVPEHKNPPPVTKYGVNYKINDNGLVIEFNPANGIIPARTEDIAKSLNTVKTGLNEIGVKADLNGSAISRIDITRNCKTNYGYDLYSEVLSEISGKRLKRAKESNEWIGKSKTLYFQNRLKDKLKNGKKTDNKFNEVICFYDKAEEKKLYDLNLLRGEYKLLDKRKTESRLTGISFSELLKNDYMEVLECVYKDNLKKNVFYMNSLECEDEDIEDDIKLFQTYYAVYREYERSQSRALILALSATGIKARNFLKNGASSLLDKAGVTFKNRTSKNRAIREIDTVMENARKISLFENNGKIIKFDDVYQEMKEKLCA